MDAEGYAMQFAFPHPAAWELSLRDGDRLVALTLCDITPRAWSAIFGFYDPELARAVPRSGHRPDRGGDGAGARDPARLPRLPRHGMPVDALQGRVPARTSCCRGFPAADEEPRWIEAVERDLDHSAVRAARALLQQRVDRPAGRPRESRRRRSARRASRRPQLNKEAK